MWWIYIIECGDSTLYTGITTDVQRRLEQHAAGTGAKYCRGKTPLTLVFQHEVGDRSLASKVERRVKSLVKSKKLELIESKSKDVVHKLLGLETNAL